VLSQHYDDGGFSGGNLDRPALQRLLADIEAGHIDCVVIYKVDRLSRSLFDFARLMQIFDRRGVSFVSVTQQFNSSTPMGRLTLHILLSFAQFEREIISERTRDKIAAARRKGKWMGGYLMLGYDPDASRTGLMMNEAEAEQVRGVFKAFLQHKLLIPTLEEIHNRGWRMKSWTTRQGQHHAGQAFNRYALVRLLSSVVYVGEVKHKGKVYPGEQPAIVDHKVWNRAQQLLQSQPRGTEGQQRNRQGALLQDLLECAGCGKAMVAGYTTKKGRRYPYYVCRTAQKRGARACPGRLVSGRRMEQAVVKALYQVAGQPGREPLQQALPVDATAWEALERREQHRILATVVERIPYDRGLQQGRVRLRPEMAGTGDVEVPLRAGKEPLVQQTPPEQMEERATEVVGGRLPRITKLMALAVRFEELLRRGTAKDYADLARLGGVSRARITQVMNLRNLAPVLQEQILWLPQDHSEKSKLNERALRRISGTMDWREQITKFEQLYAGKVPNRMR
jgi:site-specific DNA recombinase